MKCLSPGSNRGPLVCETSVITDYTTQTFGLKEHAYYWLHKVTKSMSAMKVNRMFAVSFVPRTTSCRLISATSLFLPAVLHDASTTTSTCSFPRISEGFPFFYISLFALIKNNIYISHFSHWSKRIYIYLTFRCFHICSLKKKQITAWQLQV